MIGSSLRRLLFKKASPKAIFVSESSNLTGGTVQTFAAQAIGAPDPTRIVVVAVGHGPNLSTIASVTIGGKAAIQATGASHSVASGASVDIWYLALPTGSSADVVVTYGIGETRTIIGVYNIVGAGAAFLAGGGANTTSVSTLSAAVLIPTGGAAIAILMTHSATSGSTTGINLTMDVNNIVLATSTSAMGNSVPNVGSINVGGSWLGGAADIAIATATFR